MPLDAGFQRLGALNTMNLYNFSVGYSAHHRAFSQSQLASKFKPTHVLATQLPVSNICNGDDEGGDVIIIIIIGAVRWTDDVVRVAVLIVVPVDVRLYVAI
jgi:hypothetical protein